MDTVLQLDPIISEFDIQQEADGYDTWFCTKVEKSIADPPHQCHTMKRGLHGKNKHTGELSVLPIE